MAKRERSVGIDQRISEDVVIMPSGCQNWILLDDATVDALANGICPEALAERMWRLKGLEREAIRVEAQEFGVARSGQDDRSPDRHG